MPVLGEVVNCGPKNETENGLTSGNAFVVYEISRQVLPTAPSPTMTHLTFCIIDMANPAHPAQKRPRQCMQRVSAP